jgi:ribosomal protein L11 methyltransferase
MPWLSVVLETDAEYAEALSDALLDEGALSVSAEDADAGTPAEQPQFGEPGTETRVRWTRSLLRVLCRSEEDISALLARAAKAAGLANMSTYCIETLADEDWVRRTQEQFRPIEVSEHLWIVPSWHRPPRADAINIVIDPGLAFGTGTHATTRLCLRWLQGTLRGGEHILDYGCGSGILAIAALKLGAAAALGVDIDADAIAAARHNAHRNGVAAVFQAAESALELEADIVIANILANPLILLAPALARHVRTGGMLALSGILEQQAPEVIAAYRPAFELTPVAVEEGWICLAGIKPA